jgi:hypothetical protein
MSAIEAMKIDWKLLQSSSLMIRMKIILLPWLSNCWLWRRQSSQPSRPSKWRKIDVYNHENWRCVLRACRTSALRCIVIVVNLKLYEIRTVQAYLNHQKHCRPFARSNCIRC